MTKRLCALLTIIMLFSLLQGCYDRREVDDLAYVVSIGIDKGKTNNIRLTLQMAIPTVISGGGGGGSGGDGGGGGSGGDGGGGGAAENKSVAIVTVEAPSILSGLNMVNTSVSKQISLSHTKVLVISEDKAREGIGKYVMSLSRLRDFRPNTFTLISKDSAEDYLKTVNPQLVTNPAKYFEQMASSYGYTGFTANTQFFRFYSDTKSACIKPVATLAAVSKYKSPDDFINENSTYKKKGKPYPFEGDFKAGDVPTITKEKTEIMGLAVFDGAKMVGELDGEQAGLYSMVTGDYNISNITLPDPLDKEAVVILSVKKSRNPVHKVEMVNGKPNIYVKIMLEADILGIQSGVNYEEDGKRHLLEQSYEKHFKSEIIQTLNRTAKEYKSDIFGFGREAKKKFLTLKEWEDFNWLGRYKDSTFTVDVDLQIRRPGILVRSMPIISSEGSQKP